MRVQSPGWVAIGLMTSLSAWSQTAVDEVAPNIPPTSLWRRMFVSCVRTSPSCAGVGKSTVKQMQQERLYLLATAR